MGSSGLGVPLASVKSKTKLTAKSKWELFLSNFWVSCVQMVCMNAVPNRSRKVFRCWWCTRKKKQNWSYALQVLFWCEGEMGLELFSFKINTNSRLLPSPLLPESLLTSIFSALVLILTLGKLGLFWLCSGLSASLGLWRL